MFFKKDYWTDLLQQMLRFYLRFRYESRRSSDEFLYYKNQEEKILFCCTKTKSAATHALMRKQKKESEILRNYLATKVCPLLRRKKFGAANSDFIFEHDFKKDDGFKKKT